MRSPLAAGKALTRACTPAAVKCQPARAAANAGSGRSLMSTVFRVPDWKEVAPAISRP